MCLCSPRRSPTTPIVEAEPPGTAGPAGLLVRRARRVRERIDALAAITETPDAGLTRTFGSDAMRRANALAGEWMLAAGLSVEVDVIGNVRGFQAAAPGAETTPCPLLLLGSHLDTVRDAGRFDGPLGVILAIELAEAATRGAYGELPFRLGVVGFSDEEGTRFQSSYLGSEVLAGRPFDAARLALADAAGVTIAQAILDLGSHPDALPVAALHRSPAAGGGVVGYCEVHIEQGPVLEAENLPVGIVSAIAGQSRFSWEFAGQPGHAGTTPMHLRRDALTAAAEFILAVEDQARRTEGLVATVGQLETRPGAGNVIPGRTIGSLDVRSADDGQRSAACTALHRAAENIAAHRGLTFSWRLVQENAATPCDPGLRAALAEAVRACGWPARELPSGAGHDAVALAPVMPVAMLFVRCRGGLSHHPLEHASVEDIAAALKVMDKFLILLRIPPPRGEREGRCPPGLPLLNE